MSRGTHRNKNRRTYISRKRREAQTRIKIYTKPEVYRTLRKEPRRVRQKKIIAKYVHPWMRNNPAYRFQERDCASASLLGLPAEIRQAILSLCFEKEKPPPVRDYVAYLMYYSAGRTAKMEALCKQIADLCCVSPVLRQDMEYVGKQKKEEFLEELQKRTDQEKKGFAWREADEDALRWDQTLPLSKRRKGRLVVAKFSKKARPQRCWKCDERHPIHGECSSSVQALSHFAYDRLRGEDVVCPAERRDSKKWLQDSKVYKARSKMLQKNQGSGAVSGQKIRFDD